MTNTQLFFAMSGMLIGTLGLYSTLILMYINHRFSDLYRYLDLNIKIILDKIEELEKKR